MYPDKCFEFWHHHLEKLQQEGWVHVKDYGDFIKKIHKLDSISENASLVTADVVVLYPSIPNEVGFDNTEGSFG